jgi:hypothetical protein
MATLTRQQYLSPSWKLSLQTQPSSLSQWSGQTITANLRFQLTALHPSDQGDRPTLAGDQHLLQYLCQTLEEYVQGYLKPDRLSLEAPLRILTAQDLAPSPADPYPPLTPQTPAWDGDTAAAFARKDQGDEPRGEYEQSQRDPSDRHGDESPLSHKNFADRHLANHHLPHSQIVDRELADRELADSDLADHDMVDREMVDRNLATIDPRDPFAPEEESPFQVEPLGSLHHSLRQGSTTLDLSTVELFDLLEVLDQCQGDLAILPDWERLRDRSTGASLGRSLALVGATMAVSVGVTVGVMSWMQGQGDRVAATSEATAPPATTLLPDASAPSALGMPPLAGEFALPPVPLGPDGTPLSNGGLATGGRGVLPGSLSGNLPGSLPGTLPGSLPGTGAESLGGSRVPGLTPVPSTLGTLPPPPPPGWSPLPPPPGFSGSIPGTIAPGAVRVPIQSEVATANGAIEQPSANRLGEAESTAAARAIAPPPMAPTADAAASDPGLAAPDPAITSSQVSQVQSHFQGTWGPQPNLTAPVSYSLTLGPDGTVQGITPQGTMAETFLDRTGTPLLGESLVSPASDGYGRSIGVTLYPDGGVEAYSNGTF